jgi:hypothetical protein
VVEFAQEIHVNLVLDTATHNPVEEGVSDQPIPVYSPFLWLSSGQKDSAGSGQSARQVVTHKADPLPVFSDDMFNEASNQSGQYSSISEQMIRLCQADEISDINHRLIFFFLTFFIA